MSAASFSWGTGQRSFSFCSMSSLSSVKSLFFRYLLRNQRFFSRILCMFSFCFSMRSSLNCLASLRVFSLSSWRCTWQRKALTSLSSISQRCKSTWLSLSFWYFQSSLREESWTIRQSLASAFPLKSWICSLACEAMAAKSWDCSWSFDS